MFEQIVAASKGKQIVMFLDYDGTLSPIVEDPDQAFMPEEVNFFLFPINVYHQPIKLLLIPFFVSNQMRATVRDVARYFPTAIVTGRCRDKVHYCTIILQSIYFFYI